MMYTVNDTTTAIFFCVLTMIGWGSWANTQKLAGREDWPFELFYWDYSLGVALAGWAIAMTLGNHGQAGVAATLNLHDASRDAIWKAIEAGSLFNLANILLVAGIDSVGMAVAFPVGIGLALVIGTAVNYWQTPKGNLVYLSAGVLLILCAMLVSAAAYRKLPQPSGRKTSTGLLFSVGAGLLMGMFYPQLMNSISPAFNTSPIRPGLLTPYTALLFFGIGVLGSSLVLNTLFMRSRGSRFSRFWKARWTLHIPGLLGGVIWMTALALNIIASGVAGPAVSYALGQGATLIAALWGVFVWREFRQAPSGTNRLLAVMLTAYAAGIIVLTRAVE